MKKINALLLSLLSGVLLWAAWPGSPLTPLIFFAWIPLLVLADTPIKKRTFWLYSYFTMLVWNVGTTWWIWNATDVGSVAAWLVNSLLMTIPWLGYLAVKTKLNRVQSLIALVAFWMSFEFLHLQDWGLSWPWLTLGNVFAMHPEMVKWYQFTGTAGGSLLVWAINILIYLHLKNERKNYWYPASAIFILILATSFRFWCPEKNSTNNNSTLHTVVVQPNVNPYEKVTPGTSEAQLEKLIKLSEDKIDDSTNLLVWPETALYSPYGYNESRLLTEETLPPLWNMLKRHPQLKLFTGVESYNITSEATAYSRKIGDYNIESYNGSVLLNQNGTISRYHKSMLVPGVETLPWFLNFMSAWFDKFGGATAGYAKQTERTVVTDNDKIKIAPAICYESIYGGFMRKFVKNGANVICVITNDGWWKNTPGHIQHFNYARLRAIENNCWVIRSANTGISAFINPNGQAYSPQPYGEMAVIKMDIPIQNQELTFYSKYGDWLSYLMLVLTATFIAIAAVRKSQK